MSGLPKIDVPETISVAFETNWRGYLGHIVELPGAYVRGPTEEDAIPKVRPETEAYCRWLGMPPRKDWAIRVTQKHRSILMIEDADTEILLNADVGDVSEEEYRGLVELLIYSGRTFADCYEGIENKDWIDESAVRRTFYGVRPASARSIFEHVNRCQFYYLSRMKIADEVGDDFMAVREFCLDRLEKLYRKSNNSLIIDVDQERWTLKKVLRRFLWHDRIHGKAMIRILEKQRRLRLIETYDDRFSFGIADDQRRLA